MGYILLGIIVVIWVIIMLTSKRIYSFCFLLVISTINFNDFSINSIASFDFEVYIKLLFFLTIMLFVCIRGLSLRFIIPICVMIGLFGINIALAKFDNLYTLNSALTAIFTVMLGFSFYFLLLTENDKIKVLKIIVLLPVISMILGIILIPLGIQPFKRGDGFGLAGASSSTNLAFYCVVSMVACLYLFKKYSFGNYRTLFYLIFIMLCATLTRGGILAGLCLFIFDIMPYLKSIFTNKKRIIYAIIVFSILILPFIFIVRLLIERTFMPEGINTSGRLEAWSYILSLSRNKFVGNGYGFLKTRDDSMLSAFTAAHNEYIHLYLEIGILGCLLFSFVIIYLWHQIVNHNSKVNGIKFFAFSIILMLMVYSFFDNTITNYHFWITFMFVLSVVSSYTTEFEPITNQIQYGYLR